MPKGRNHIKEDWKVGLIKYQKELKQLENEHFNEVVQDREMLMKVCFAAQWPVKLNNKKMCVQYWPEAILLIFCFNSTNVTTFSTNFLFFHLLEARFQMLSKHLKLTKHWLNTTCQEESETWRLFGTTQLNGTKQSNYKKVINYYNLYNKSRNINI